MALSDKAKKSLAIALGSDKTESNPADEIVAAIESGSNPQAAAVADIADPSTADAEECADKINELLASLRAAGMLAE